jgi:hypothetical protein
MKENSRPEVQKVIELGKMSIESDSGLSEKHINRYAHYLRKVGPPITLQEAKQLVKVFPGTTLYEVEWLLLHLFELVYVRICAKEHMRLIEMCPSQPTNDCVQKCPEVAIKARNDSNPHLPQSPRVSSLHRLYQSPLCQDSCQTLNLLARFLTPYEAS